MKNVNMKLWKLYELGILTLNLEFGTSNFKLRILKFGFGCFPAETNDFYWFFRKNIQKHQQIEIFMETHNKHNSFRDSGQDRIPYRTSPFHNCFTVWIGWSISLNKWFLIIFPERQKKHQHMETLGCTDSTFKTSWPWDTHHMIGNVSELRLKILPVHLNTWILSYELFHVSTLNLSS